MSLIFRTIIVPAEHVETARTLAAAVSPAGIGMFTSALYTGETLSHYVSTGKIDSDFALVLSDVGIAMAAALAGDPEYPGTTEQLTALLAAVDVSEEPPFDAFARLGLQLVQSEEL
ncbi:MAG TPA: hypothetical protein DDZ92_03895 [Halomonas sp.]|nr:hypothetical protein [Halomonas sp.]|tara:strand:- start:1477 stop:1824 length:348 start_codon:yes stop_codon:yes gene_type:complete